MVWMYFVLSRNFCNFVYQKVLFILIVEVKRQKVFLRKQSTHIWSILTDFIYGFFLLRFIMVKDFQENYGNGWISIYRSIQNHWVWQDDKIFKIWISFLLKANHQDNKFYFDGILYEVKRGSFITSLKKLSSEFNCSIGKMRRILNSFEKDSMIDSKSDTRKTQITICNYDTYQDSWHTKSTLTENRRNADGKQTETNNNDNNVNNDNNKEGVLYPINKVKTEYFLDMLPIDSTQQFIEAWTEWVDFRKEIKKKLTKLSAKRQITFLINQPEPIKCINQSIQNGWTGLFEVSQKQAGKIIQNEYTYQELSEMSSKMSKEERVKFWDKYEIQENKKWRLKQ